MLGLAPTYLTAAKPKPRAWLRHTPYLNGRGRLKTQPMPNPPDN